MRQPLPICSRLLWLSVAFGLVACPSPQPPETSFDLGTCGATCGSGPLFVINQLEFVLASEDDVSPGFDLDGLSGDCDVPDLTSPEGEQGIDNRFGSVMGVLPATVRDTLPQAVQDAINRGDMSILLEVVGADTLTESADGVLVARFGSGPVLLGNDGRLLPEQTFDLDPDPLLGMAEPVRIDAGGLTTSPFELELRLTFLGIPIRFMLMDTRLHFSQNLVDRTITGLVGGVIPLEDAMGLVGLLGGDDTELREQLEALVPLLVDSRLDPDGPCDGLSAAIALTGVPAFVFDD